MPGERRVSRATGFSLVETVAALAILSLAAVPLMQLSTDAVQNTARLESRLLARTTAENVLARAMASRQTLETGQTAGSETQLGRAYEWTLSARPAGRPDLLQLEVRVSEAGGGQELARLMTLKAVAP